MSEFKVGDRLLSRDGETGTCTGFGARAVGQPEDAVWWQNDRRALGDETYCGPGYFSLLEPETPTPGTIVDVTRRTITKTVEEEVVEYPELPALTVVEDAYGAVWLHAGFGCLWFRASADDQPYPDSALSWPVKVLRYGKGNA